MGSQLRHTKSPIFWHKMPEGKLFQQSCFRKGFMKQSARIFHRLSFLVLFFIFLPSLFTVFGVENSRHHLSMRSFPGTQKARLFSLNPARMISPTNQHSALVYSTYLGGMDLDEASSVAVDANGYVYITGYTKSTNFPATPIVSRYEGFKIFVAKIDITNNKNLYTVTLPGIPGFFGYIPFHPAIVVDTAGSAYITGATSSPDFPVTQGAFQTSLQGTASAFITKLDASGKIVYSTFLGGSENSYPFPTQHVETAGTAIAVDGLGNAYVTGYTDTLNFPTTANALKVTSKTDFCPSPPIPPPSTGTLITQDSQSNVRVDAFVTKLNPTGTALVYSTYLGGSCPDYATGIVVDGAGNAYVTGKTENTDFPIVNGLQKESGGQEDAFVAKLNADGSALLYSTYLGGTSNDAANAIAIDAEGNAYITGESISTDLPATAGAFQPLNAARSSLRSTDGGATWISMNNQLPVTPAFIQSAPNLLGTVYAGSYNILYKSTDNGLMWEKIGSVDKGYVMAIDPQNPSTAYAQQYQTGGIPLPPILLKTTDEGRTWKRMDFFNNIQNLLIDPKNSAVLYINTGTQIYKSLNGGDSWEDITGELPSGDKILLAIDPTGNSTPFVKTINHPARVFKSAGGRKKWKPVDLEGNYTESITFDPVTPSTVYASGANLFKSIDSGNNWTKLETNLFSTFVGNLLIDPANPSVMYASADSGLATSDGFFKSMDGGRTWKELLSDAPLSSFYKALAPGTPATIYAASDYLTTDAFVAKLNPSGSKLIYYTYLGGTSEDRGNGIAVDSTGNAFITGETRSFNFPIKNGFQPSLNTLDFVSDAFLTKLDANGAMFFSTYYGGSSSTAFSYGQIESARAVALDKFNNAYIAGGTTSTDLPLSNSLQQYAGEGDAFFARIIETVPFHPAPIVSSITPSAGSAAGNTTITIHGANFREGARISIGGSPATQVQVINSNTIQAVTSKQASMITTVFVTNADGQSGFLNSGFTYLRVPEISQVYKDKKRLVVIGRDFDRGAVFVVDGETKATDPTLNPYFVISTKKTLKKLPLSRVLQVQVRNGSGIISPPRPFIRQP
jgi:photosystem II stability/assembly factor-like uncharacterized protein